MALRFQSVFKSKDGNTYAINIYDPTYSGTVSQLIPADEPFVTREDDDDNPFTPMRPQSGYIRIIDTDNEIFEEIVPANNTQLMVAVYGGTWDGTTFQIDPFDLQWQGFIQSQVYTQPWTEHKNILELPVISILGALQYISLSPSDSNTTYNIFQIVSKASAQLGVNFTIRTCCDLNFGALLNMYVRKQVLLKTINAKRISDGEVIITTGLSFYEILEQWATLLGLTWRESTDGIEVQLCLMQMSRFYPDSLLVYSYSAAGSASYISALPYVGLSDIEFRSTDNKTSILQGRKSVQLSFSIKNMEDQMFEFPVSPETVPQLTGMRTWVFNERVDQYGVYIYGTDYDKQLDIEVYAHGSQAGVSYKYYEVQGNVEIESASSNIKDWSYINLPNKDIWGESDVRLLCGAVPCRFDYRNFNTSRTELRQGHLFNIRAARTLEDIEWGGFHGWLMDFTNSSVTLRGTEWINIQLHCIPFYNEHFPTTETPPYPIQTGIKSKTKRIIIKACVRCGNQFFDNRGENYQWTTDIQPTLLRFDPETGNLVSNYNESMGVSDIGGYYIPAPAGTFEISFQVVNEIYVGAQLYPVLKEGSTIPVRGGTGEAGVDAHTVVMDNLSVKVISRKGYGTRSGENVYYKEIINGRFEESEEVTLDIGTNNNNGYAVNTLCSADGLQDVDAIHYTQGYKRPEGATLDQMANYFAVARRIHTARILSGIDWMMHALYYGREQKAFYAITEERDWKQNEETVKLIETNLSNV